MIIHEMGRPHGPGDAVHQSSIKATTDVNHNLAWQEPHVELGVNCLRLTSFHTVAVTRQGCARLCDITTYLPMSCVKHTTKGGGYEDQRDRIKNNGGKGNLSTLFKDRICLLTPSPSITLQFRRPCSRCQGNSAETVPPLLVQSTATIFLEGR